MHDHESPSTQRALHRRASSHPLRAAFVAAALLAGASAAKAQHTYLDAYLSGRSPTVHLTDVAGWYATSGPSTGYVPNTTTPNGLTGTMSVGGQSSYGLAKAIATGSGAGYYGGMFAYWNDVITFNGGPAGTTGIVTYKMTFDWSHTFEVGVGGYATATPYVDINMASIGPTGTLGPLQYAYVQQASTRSCSAANFCVNSGGAFETGSIDFTGGQAPDPRVSGNTAYFSFAVKFGQAYQITPGMNAFVQGENSTTTTDASHSLYWGGISEVVDAGGHVVSSSVTSASGFDYAQAVPVPEPAAPALMLLGLGGLVVAVKRRRGPAVSPA